MPRCQDPLITQLNALGFNALRIPRTDYEPTCLLVRQGEAVPVLFGSLDEGFANVSKPEFTIGSVGQLEKGSSAKYQRRLGLKFASDWLRSPLAKLDAMFAATKHISYRFGEMRLLSVSLAVLNQIIIKAEPTTALANVSESRLFLISEVLQAKEFILITEGDSTKAVTAQALALDAIVTNVEGSIDATHSQSGILVFKATKYHSIGFKAYEIEVAGGGFRLAPSGASSALSHMSQDEPSFNPVLFEEHALF